MAIFNTPTKYKKKRLTCAQLDILDTILSHGGKSVKLPTLVKKHSHLARSTIQGAVQKLKELNMIKSVQHKSVRVVKLIPIYANIDVVFVDYKNINASKNIFLDKTDESDFLALLKRARIHYH